ncbi:hypothetical protein MJO29_008382 [Puccinia striiformis f. sp. tritici]|nr:hypothetical protein Pst134EB_016563 [Puccinia striiformis f. sp. tritici]KAI7952751.1 hypothetical protein MJO29_008382 [Puccinia striiformis f. sp. tritici]
MLFSRLLIVTIIGAIQLAESRLISDTLPTFGPLPADQGIFEGITVPNVDQRKPTLAGYMPKRYTNIENEIGSKSLYMKTGEAARLLGNTFSSNPTNHDFVEDSASPKLRDPTDESHGDEQPTEPLESNRILNSIIWTNQPIIEFGQPSEDDGVRILEPDSNCSICHTKFKDPRKNLIGELEWQLIHSCPGCMACYHPDCLESWRSIKNRCPSCNRIFSLIPVCVINRIDARTRTSVLCFCMFLVVAFLYALIKKCYD